jgi:hypothetical protein
LLHDGAAALRKRLADCGANYSADVFLAFIEAVLNVSTVSPGHCLRQRARSDSGCRRTWAFPPKSSASCTATLCRSARGRRTQRPCFFATSLTTRSLPSSALPMAVWCGWPCARSRGAPSDAAPPAQWKARADAQRALLAFYDTPEAEGLPWMERALAFHTACVRAGSDWPHADSITSPLARVAPAPLASQPLGTASTSLERARSPASLAMTFRSLFRGFLGAVTRSVHSPASGVHQSSLLVGLLSIVANASNLQVWDAVPRCAAPPPDPVRRTGAAQPRVPAHDPQRGCAERRAAGRPRVGVAGGGESRDCAAPARSLAPRPRPRTRTRAHARARSTRLAPLRATSRPCVDAAPAGRSRPWLIPSAVGPFVPRVQRGVCRCLPAARWARPQASRCAPRGSFVRAGQTLGSAELINAKNLVSTFVVQLGPGRVHARAWEPTAPLATHPSPPARLGPAHSASHAAVRRALPRSCQVRASAQRCASSHAC